MNKIAPIAYFTYNRPEHTLRSLEALAANFHSKDHVLHIFSDGPKSDASDEDIRAINKVREIIRSREWCGTTTIHESPVNKGLFCSITEGIDHVLSTNDRIIVLEDDIVTAPGFLDFCNRGLDKYEQDENVWLISGYMFPLNSSERLADTFFLPTLSCWGWCTWKRAWNRFSPDAESLLKKIDEGGLKHLFDLHSSYPYHEMLKQRVSGKNQSWDVCWYASFFLGNGLCLYPGNTLVENIGMDGSGTHWVGRNSLSKIKDKSSDSNLEFPKKTEADLLIQQKLEKSLRRTYSPGIKDRIIRKLKSILHSIV